MKIPDGSTAYNDGERFDLSIKEVADLPFYAELAKEYGDPILELCCGTGRIAIPLAEKGFNVTGIDISKPFLALAKKKAKAAKVDIEWVYGDIRDFSLHRKFRLILIPFNSVAHVITVEDFRSMMACIKRHLTADGRLVISYFNPNLETLLRDPNQRWKKKEYFDTRVQATIAVTESSSYDQKTQVNHVTRYFRNTVTNEETTDELFARIYFPMELEALITGSGFEFEHTYGGYHHEPFTSTSQLHINICRKR